MGTVLAGDTGDQCAEQGKTSLVVIGFRLVTKKSKSAQIEHIKRAPIYAAEQHK
jgi:hypothetical protein